jgi:hypothetical protein
VGRSRKHPTARAARPGEPHCLQPFLVSFPSNKPPRAPPQRSRQFHTARQHKERGWGGGRKRGLGAQGGGAWG